MNQIFHSNHESSYDESTNQHMDAERLETANCLLSSIS